MYEKSKNIPVAKPGSFMRGLIKKCICINFFYEHPFKCHSINYDNNKHRNNYLVPRLDR